MSAVGSQTRDDNEESDHVDELEAFIESLSLDEEKEPIVSEIGVLRSIYGDETVRIWTPKKGAQVYGTDDTVRYTVVLDLPPPHESPDTKLKILVSLPTSYPKSSPPQLQLLSRYIGAFSVDSNLFGSILRTFISMDGVEWTEDSVCVFDGLENVRERCAIWYAERLSEERAQDILREDEKERHHMQNDSGSVDKSSELHTKDPDDYRAPTSEMPDGVDFFIADPIVERKSVFIGRACRITDPSQVPRILVHLMSDRRIARATHPIINAWRCTVSGVLHQDNDDDGETAAGGRIAHLLQILDVDNVLVVVTRYFGGTLLGPDRFKFINQAARNALELGGFLDSQDDRKATSRSKKRI